MQDSLVKMFKALSNPTRFQLFVEILDAGESSYEDDHSCFLSPIIQRLEVGAPTVSHHLKELVNAGLIVTDKRGKFVTCRVNDQSLQTLGGFFRRASP